MQCGISRRRVFVKLSVEFFAESALGLALHVMHRDSDSAVSSVNIAQRLCLAKMADIGVMLSFRGYSSGVEF